MVQSHDFQMGGQEPESGSDLPKVIESVTAEAKLEHRSSASKFLFLRSIWHIEKGCRRKLLE